MDYKLTIMKMKNSNKKTFILIMLLVHSFTFAQTFNDDVQDVPIDTNITFLGLISILLIFILVFKKKTKIMN